MQKTFKTLNVGDKIYIGLTADFIHDIKFENGYLAIQTHYKNINEVELCAWHGRWYYIPQNHLNANKIKVKGHLWIHLTKSGYKKHMYNFIKKEIER
jgi:hypothetical protein